MNEDSLLPPPTQGLNVGGGTSWGRGRDNLGNVSHAVTPDLPSATESPPTGYPPHPELSRKRSETDTERKGVLVTVAKLIDLLQREDPTAEVGEEDELGRFFPLQKVKADRDAVLLECWVTVA